MIRAILFAAASYAAYRVFERIRAENTPPPKLLAPPASSPENSPPGR